MDAKYLFNNNLLDKQKLLLQYYKQLHLDEKAVVLILQIENLKELKKPLSTKNLVKRMSLSEQEINMIMNELVKVRKLIRLSKSDRGTVTLNTDAIYTKLGQILFQEEVKQKQKAETNKKLNMIKIFENEFERNLSPMEIEILREWTQSYNKEIITDSLKIAVMQGVVNFSYIEAILKDKVKLLNE